MTRLYHYDPSLAAAVIFIVLFTAASGLHVFQMVKTKTWFFIAFCIGGIFEIIGYAARAKGSSETHLENYSLGAYVIQSVFLLVAPALFAASIYMELGRIVELVDGDKYLFIRRRWLTRTFVAGDVLSFLMQAAGGGLMGTDKDSTRDTGSKVIVGGLFVQIAFFGCFILAAVLFHVRLRKTPTDKILTDSPPYRRHIFALYATSILIFIRSTVRVIEFIQGFDGYIIEHEAFIYVFDAAPMLVVMLIMNWIHPSEVKSLLRGGKMSKGLRLVELSDSSRVSVPSQGSTAV